MTYNVNDDDGADALDLNQAFDRWQFSVKSGCAVSINSGTLAQADTLTVASGSVFFDGGGVSVSSQSVQIDAADTSNPRKDVVYVDSSGNAQVAKGSAEAATPGTATRFETYRPAPSDLSATGAVVLAEVWVPAGASSITASDLRDRRTFADLAAQSATIDRLSIGDSVGGDADILVYKDGGTTRAVDSSGTLVENTDAGTVIDTVFSTHITDGDDLLISPGTYDTSSVSTIATAGKFVTVDARGVEINSTFRVETWPVDVIGLTVDGAAGNGFEWFRAQGATFADLRARNCGGDGFVLGGEANAQVAYGYWSGCNAKTNAGRGWVLDGSFSNNWVNANVFSGCVSRQNGDTQTTDHGLETTGVANYNTWLGFQAEGNDGDFGAVVDTDENTFLGGHIVGNTASIHFPGTGTTNVIMGGRHPTGIQDDTTNGTGWFGFANSPGSMSKFWIDNVGGAAATDVDRGNIIFDPTNGRIVWKDGNGNAYYASGTAL